jgi:hypothetical protein
MKKYISIVLVAVSINSSLLAENCSAESDFYGAQSSDTELVSSTGLPLTPRALRALYNIAQQCVAQKTEKK